MYLVYQHYLIVLNRNIFKPLKEHLRLEVVVKNLNDFQATCKVFLFNIFWLSYCLIFII